MVVMCSQYTFRVRSNFLALSEEVRIPVVRKFAAADLVACQKTQHSQDMLIGYPIADQVEVLCTLGEHTKSPSAPSAHTGGGSDKCILGKYGACSGTRAFKYTDRHIRTG